MLNMEIKELPAVRVATVRHVGPFCDLKPAFEKICAWGGQAGVFGPTTRVIGIFHDDPQSTAAAELRSDACVTVGDDVTPSADSGVTIREIPAGTYAVGVMKGPYEQLESAYKWIYSTWASEPGRTLLPQASYEVYLNDPTSVPPSELMTEICVPIQGHK